MTAPETTTRIEYVAGRVGSADVENIGSDLVKAREIVAYWNTLPFTGQSPYYVIKRTITEEAVA